MCSPWSLVHGLGCRTRPLLGSGLRSPPEPWWSPDSNTCGAAPVRMLPRTESLCPPQEALVIGPHLQGGH